MERATPPSGGTAGQTPETAPKPGALLEDWMTRDEMAGELGLSVDTLSRWETRRIGPPSVRVGRKVLYRRGAVQDWLKGQEDRTAKSRGR